MQYGRKGFTLIELIIVIVIIGILAVITVPMMQEMTKKAKKAEAITALGTIRTAERSYRVEYGSYTNVTDFSNAANPLNAYIPPGELNGRYYNEGSYSSRADYTPVGPPDLPTGSQALYIQCINSTTSGVITTTTWMWMLENGNTGDISYSTAPA